MRVTGGEFKGLRLYSPKGLKVRPTSDMVRQALFNILKHKYIQEWNEAKVLDLFAGTGALGIEALSRGASEAFFVESHQTSVSVLKKNLEKLNLAEKSKIIKARIDNPSKRLLKILEQQSFDILFSDPPYSSGLSKDSLMLIANTGCLAPDGILVVEEKKWEKLPNKLEGKKLHLHLVDTRFYGQTALWFYAGEKKKTGYHES